MKNYFLLIVFAFNCIVNVYAQAEDCNGVINGSAVLDDCGTCQLAYLYNTVTHNVTFLNSIDGVSVGSNEMLVSPQSAGNPYWNDCGQNYEVDCNKFVKGPALIDTCNICRKAYAYDDITHNITFVNHADLHELSENETIVLPDSESNPYWNDCTTSSVIESTIKMNENPKLVRVVDLLGNELKTIKPNIVFIEFYSNGIYKKRLIIK
tara:strand:+ start:59 stop:682 length:624 start_codon:yes stop_codon:yes gene_type:complete